MVDVILRFNRFTMSNAIALFGGCVVLIIAPLTSPNDNAFYVSEAIGFGLIATGLGLHSIWSRKKKGSEPREKNIGMKGR